MPLDRVSGRSGTMLAAYHCAAGPDVVANLDHDFAVRVVSATVGAVAESLGM